jgi:hypothetical protein
MSIAYIESNIKVNKFNQIKNVSLKIIIILEIINNEKVKIIMKTNSKNEYKLQYIFNIDYFTDIIRKDPLFLIKMFCNGNHMIIISIKEDINEFSDNLFNYFLAIIDNQDLKQYLKLKYV